MKPRNEFFVDRIEGEVAVLEGEELIEVALSKLPEGAKEGSCLVFEDGKYLLDSDMERTRRKDLFAKQKSLFNKK